MSDVPFRPFPPLARIVFALVLLAAPALGSAQNDVPPHPPGGPIADRMTAGAVIELPAGRFRLDAAPAVTGDLILRGAGRDATILVAGGGEAVNVRSGTLTLENLAIEAPGTEPNNLVYVVDGAFRITNVRLEGADPVPADEDGELGPGGNGLYAWNSVGTIVSSELIGNKRYAVYATSGTDVTLRDVTVQGGWHGIRISEDGTRGTLERVTIDDVTGDAVYLAGAVDVGMSAVTVRRATGAGIFVAPGASVEIEGSTVADVGGGGISLDTEAVVAVSNTTALRNGLSGVIVEAGTPTLTDLVLNDNGEAGLVYFGASAGHARGITANGNGLAGVAVLGEAAPTLTDVTADGNGAYGFRVDATAAPTLEGTLVATGNETGVSDREDVAAQVAASGATDAASAAAPAGAGADPVAVKDRIEAGGEVRLGPGVHVVDGDVLPYADLRLVGEGRSATTLRIENLFDAGLDLTDLDVTLQDLTLEVVVAATPSEYPQAISADGGALIVRDAAIRVDGAAPGSLAGVVLYAGTLSMDDVEVSGFPYAGVYLESGIANLRGVAASGNGNGIEVQTIVGEGFAEIRDAELIGNELAGLAVFDGASARLQGGIVAENATEGVFVNGTGSVTLDGVRIADNPAYGIYADGGRVTATGVDFANNRNAVWALGAADVTVERSTIEGDTGFGVAGNGTGTTTLRDVTIRGSTYSNITIEEERRATLERVTSAFAGESGLIVRDDASATVANARFENNGNDGIAVEDAAGVDVRSSVMAGNGRYGILLATTGAYALENVTYVGNSGGDLIEPDDPAARPGPSRSDAGEPAPDRATPDPAAPGAATPDPAAPDPVLAPVGWTIDASSGTPYAFAYGAQTSIGLGCGADGAPFAVLFVDGGPTQGRSDFVVDDGGQPIDLITTGDGVHQLSSSGSTFAAAEDLIFTARFEDEITVHATLDGARVPILAYRGGPAFQVVLDGLGCL